MSTEIDPRHNPAGSDVHLSTTEARSGATPHMARYALGGGLVLVIVAFIAVLAYYKIAW